MSRQPIPAILQSLRVSKRDLPKRSPISRARAATVRRTPSLFSPAVRRRRYSPRTRIRTRSAARAPHMPSGAGVTACRFGLRSAAVACPGDGRSTVSVPCRTERVRVSERRVSEWRGRYPDVSANPAQCGRRRAAGPRCSGRSRFRSPPCSLPCGELDPPVPFSAERAGTGRHPLDRAAHEMNPRGVRESGKVFGNPGVTVCPGTSR